MPDLAEILLAHAQEGGTVKLGVAADEIVRPGLKVTALPGAPAVDVVVPAFENHRLGIPVLDLARHVITALEQQDSLAGRGQRIGQRAAAGAGTYDDDVVIRLGSQ